MLSMLLSQQAWLISLGLLLLMAFLFQGIAIVHAKVAPRRQGGLILGVFYALLLVFPQVVALTAITGMIDNWLDFRKLKAEIRKDDNES